MPEGRGPGAPQPASTSPRPAHCSTIRAPSTCARPTCYPARTAGSRHVRPRQLGGAVQGHARPIVVQTAVPAGRSAGAGVAGRGSPRAAGCRRRRPASGSSRRTPAGWRAAGWRRRGPPAQGGGWDWRRPGRPGAPLAPAAGPRPRRHRRWPGGRRRGRSGSRWRTATASPLGAGRAGPRIRPSLVSKASCSVVMPPESRTPSPRGTPLLGVAANAGSSSLPRHRDSPGRHVDDGPLLVTYDPAPPRSPR
jgi:hypothetical protein